MEIHPKILLVGGSPRKGGNTDRLMQHFAEVAWKEGVEAETIYLRDLDMSPCVGCELCRKTGTCIRYDDDMSKIYPKVNESRGLLLTSPVHNYNVTAWMKGFIDRLYCYYNFEEPRPGPWSSKLADQGRKAVVAAIAEQNAKRDMGFAVEAMRMPLEALGYEVLSEIPLLGTFEKGKIESRKEFLLDIRTQAKALAKEILDRGVQ